jgi:CheY-like chemotaxis protein
VAKPIWRGRLLEILAAALAGDEDASARMIVPASARAAKGRVLVVEDSDINAEVACEMLSAAGYTVDRVADGGAAVEAALGSSYDTILMDCQLPILDGFEATRRIREGERAARRQRPALIIALTASATKDDHERCLASGMDDFLAKPLDGEHLRRLLSDRSAPRAASTLPAGPAPADHPVADLTRALSRVRGNTDLLGRLAVQLHAVVPSTLDELRSALGARDTARARFLAHRLTGQVATFEAAVVVTGLEALRDAVADGRWSDADRKLGEIEVNAGRLLREIDPHAQDGRR